jgi:hypothetical protein
MLPLSELDMRARKGAGTAKRLPEGCSSWVHVNAPRESRGFSNLWLDVETCQHGTVIRLGGSIDIGYRGF